MDKVYEALNDQARRAILQILSLHQGLTVTELQKQMGMMRQSTLSGHLAVLKKSNLVGCQIKGKWRIYFLEKETLCSVVGDLQTFIGNGNMS